MATTSVAELVNRTRRMVRDWPDLDSLTASLSSTASVVSVADGTLYPKNFHIEVDQEVMTVATAGTGTTFSVRRGAWGSTATTHATASEVRLRMSFPTIQILDAINQAKDEAFPLIYRPVIDTTLSTLATTFEYTVPTLDIATNIPIPYISKIELKLSGTSDYAEVRGWSVRRGATPKIQFMDVQDPGATIRVHGFGPYPDLAYTDNMNSQFPLNAVNALPVGAAAYLLMSGEAGRSRVDTLANDAREQANRVGASSAASQILYARFRSMVLAAAMPPLPRHAKPTF